jgi:sialic acid synthase SpsE
MLISMGKREVGDGTSVFIVFEAGPTHTGLESAKKLAFHAKESGADAIKFQITDHNKLIYDKSLMFSYQALNEKGNTYPVTEPLYDIWQRRYMPREDWVSLKSYCDKIGICFFATIFSCDDIDFVKSIGVDSLKIASQDTNYQDLIEYAATKGLPVQVDTGGSSLGEIERAVDWVMSCNNDKVIINHCPSGYPARLESVNLKMIQTLKSIFRFPVAFSDHNPGYEMDIAAVAVGANIIEKTITLDRTQRSCEHMFSIEPTDMKHFVETVRSIEVALGSNRRVLAPEECTKRDSIRRSAYLIRDVEAGEEISGGDIQFMRPGWGIKPCEYQRFVGRKYSQAIKAGSMLTPEII